MAHFAKLDSNNVVIFVTVGRDEDREEELCARTGDVYRQTSYNTRGGVHHKADGTPSEDQSKAFRKNYAGLGYTFDAGRNAFIRRALRLIINEAAQRAFPNLKTLFCHGGINPASRYSRARHCPI